MLALIGQSVGSNWEQWRHRLGYLDYLIAAAILAGVVYLIAKRRRARGARGGALEVD
jgi:membrane protein DedA with SNARE-associated domain